VAVVVVAVVVPFTVVVVITRWKVVASKSIRL
jgi:hypothetical protein